MNPTVLSTVSLVFALVACGLAVTALGFSTRRWIDSQLRTHLKAQHEFNRWMEENAESQAASLRRIDSKNNMRWGRLKDQETNDDPKSAGDDVIDGGSPGDRASIKRQLRKAAGLTS